jgi:hypothetical protein
LYKPTARENGEGADLTVEAEDLSSDNSGDYRPAVNMDTHVYQWSDEEPGRLARLVMNTGSARHLVLQLTAEPIGACTLVRSAGCNRRRAVAHT